MFRGTKKKRWDADEAAALYRGVLRREASPAEADALARAISAAGTPERALVDMLSSHEFGVMVLPDLINDYVRSVPQTPVFFLHVPKTAGTSFRLALTATMGIPAFLAYVHSSWLGYGKNDTMNFWPLWAGHAGISAFPETHRGITVFRESRSRILSEYRQQEREIAVGNFSLTRFSRNDKLMSSPQAPITAADPFERWIQHTGPALQWFLEAPSDPNLHLWDGRPRFKWVRSLDRAQLRTMLSNSLDRFDAAAWAHDSDAMKQSLETITGKEAPATIGHDNSFHVESATKLTVLTADDLEHIERIAQDEKLLMELAVDKGLVPPIDPDFADDEFERTARRLGFTFA